MKLSIIIPVYNEKNTVLELLNRVNNVNFPYSYEIIIVDDGSTDGTREILNSFLSSRATVRDDKKIKIIFKSKNQGKGSALRRGFDAAKGDIIAIQDADLEYDPRDLPKLIEPILQGRADIVYGSRFLIEQRRSHGLFYFGNRIISFLFLIFYFTKITDPLTCYKIIKREVLDKIPLHLNGFDMETEFTSKALKNGYKVLELPIRYQSRSIAEGKKIKWIDGFKIIWTLIKYRFYG